MEQHLQLPPARCTELLQRYKERKTIRLGTKLHFSGVGGRDVYNISAPFHVGDAVVLAGRVEERKVRADSRVIFFAETDGVWTPIENNVLLPNPSAKAEGLKAETLELEDGFATHIDGEIIFGGVELYPNPSADDPIGVGYRTVFYRGRDLSSLQRFTVGPDRMKDIRLVSLRTWAESRIGVFTRPQGGDCGKGKIGYITLQCLENLTAQNILGAKIIENQFVPEEWGGANELFPLQDGRIGVLGHIAYQDAQDNKHYYAMSFVYDPATHQASPIEILATRNDFPAGDTKTPQLADVIFPGGLVRHNDGTATLYAGLSDAEAGSIILPDPFF